MRRASHRAMTRLPLVAPILASLLLLGGSHAQAQPAEAKRFLQQKHSAVMRALRQPAGEARTRRVSQMLGNLLDFEELSRRALSSHWEERSSEERTEFVSLLRQLVEKSYQDNLERTLNYEIRYEGEETVEDAVLIRTTARSKSNRRAPPVSINYRLRHQDDGWRVFDVITDGVSMVRNYRSQFGGIIDREGWNGLIDRMRRKLDG